MDGPVSHCEGLSDAEAAARLKRFGPNLLRERKTRGFFEIARRTLREPMFLLLLAAASLYLLLGDLGEGLFLTGGALLSLSLVIFQELRSERALAALNALAEPLARVIPHSPALRQDGLRRCTYGPASSMFTCPRIRDRHHGGCPDRARFRHEELSRLRKRAAKSRKLGNIPYQHRRRS